VQQQSTNKASAMLHHMVFIRDNSSYDLIFILLPCAFVGSKKASSKTAPAHFAGSHTLSQFPQVY